MRLRPKRIKSRAGGGGTNLRRRLDLVPTDRLVVLVRLSAKGWGTKRPEVDGARCRFSRTTGRVPLDELLKLMVGLEQRLRELHVPPKDQKSLILNLWRTLERRDWIELPVHRRMRSGGDLQRAANTEDGVTVTTPRRAASDVTDRNTS
jgi:hypothetical protein